MGSGAWADAPAPSVYTGRGSGSRASQGDGAPGGDEERNRAGLRSGFGRRPVESDSDAAPQFLVEVDDLFDEEHGQSRLVAPPVLGEAPPSYRDF